MTHFSWQCHNLHTCNFKINIDFKITGMFALFLGSNLQMYVWSINLKLKLTPHQHFIDTSPTWNPLISVSYKSYLPWSSPLPIAINASRSVPLRPYWRSSLAASMSSGTRSRHSCRTHERLVILLWKKYNHRTWSILWYWVWSYVLSGICSRHWCWSYTHFVILLGKKKIKLHKYFVSLPSRLLLPLSMHFCPLSV